EKRVVRILRSGRVDRLELSGKRVPGTVVLVRLFVGSPRTSRQVHWCAEALPIAPGCTLMGRGSEDDRNHRLETFESVVGKPDRVDEHGLPGLGADRVRGARPSADVRVCDAPVEDARHDFFDVLGNNGRLGHTAMLVGRAWRTGSVSTEQRWTV